MPARAAAKLLEPMRRDYAKAVSKLAKDDAYIINLERFPFPANTLAYCHNLFDAGIYVSHDAIKKMGCKILSEVEPFTLMLGRKMHHMPEIPDYEEILVGPPSGIFGIKDKIDVSQSEEWAEDYSSYATNLIEGRFAVDESGSECNALMILCESITPGKCVYLELMDESFIQLLSEGDIRSILKHMDHIQLSFGKQNWVVFK